MTFMYKMLKGDVIVNFNDFFDFKNSSTRSKHQYVVKVKYSRLEIVRSNFFFKSINDWNQLERDLFATNSVSSFKAMLEKSYQRDGLPSETE